MDDLICTAGAVLAAREKLASVTPLWRDCGALCGAACCQPDSEGLGGMLLFPGEETLYKSLPEGFHLEEVPEGRLLVCQGVCARLDRPLACRVFPLMFTLGQGQGGVMMDKRAWPLCPLMPDGLSGLRADFVLAAREAAALLVLDEKQRAFLAARQREAAEWTRAPWQKGGTA